MTAARTAVLAAYGVRLAYGSAMLAAPGRVGTKWLGRPSPTAASDVPLRGIGGREIALHAAGLLAIGRGAPTRPWLLASLGGDVTDIVASVVQRDQLPEGGLRAVLLTGGGSALLTAALLAASGDD
jgi:hypothetical protein